METKSCAHQCFLQNFPYVICRKINAPAACPNSKECENFTEQPDGEASGTVTGAAVGAYAPAAGANDQTERV